MIICDHLNIDIKQIGVSAIVKYKNAVNGFVTVILVQNKKITSMGQRQKIRLE